MLAPAAHPLSFCIACCNSCKRVLIISRFDTASRGMFNVIDRFLWIIPTCHEVSRITSVVSRDDINLHGYFLILHRVNLTLSCLAKNSGWSNKLLNVTVAFPACQDRLKRWLIQLCSLVRDFFHPLPRKRVTEHAILSQHHVRVHQQLSKRKVLLLH